MQSKQSHANTPRHDDPCDNWEHVGTFLRAEVERVRKAVELQRAYDEFYEGEREFAANYARRWR